MKKENRKLAQAQRSAMRKKAEQQKKIKKILTYGIPILIILILAVVIIVDAVNNSSGSSSADTEISTGEAAETESDETEDTTETASDSEDSVNYSTDTSLTVKDGDTVNIDYVGSIDGVEFDGGSTNGSGTDLTIGSGLYIDDFEDQLIGAHPGDEVDVTVTFPENYGVEDLNGKEALFEVTINGIYEN